MGNAESIVGGFECIAFWRMIDATNSQFRINQRRHNNYTNLFLLRFASALQFHTAIIFRLFRELRLDLKNLSSKLLKVKVKLKWADLRPKQFDVPLWVLVCSQHRKKSTFPPSRVHKTIFLNIFECFSHDSKSDMLSMRNDDQSFMNSK